MPGSRVATIIALAVYLGTLIVVGIVTRRRSTGFAGFVTGGGSIPPWMLAVSFLANFISSNSFVGHAAKSYETGLIWCLVGIIIVASCALSWVVFAPRFAAFSLEHGAVTLPDFFERRFASRGLTALVNGIVVVSSLLYVLAVLRGTGLVLGSGLGVSYEAALVILWVVTLAYCCLGGLWADVSTDVIQAVFLVLGAVGLFLAVATAAPDPAAAPRPISPPPLGLVLAVGMGGGLKMLADPKQVMVFFALPSEEAARRFRWIGPTLLLVCYACLLPVGFLARPLVPGVKDLETLVPTLIFDRQLVGAWFGTPFLVALLAASMSSLDSALLVIASCLEKHVVAPLLRREPSDRRTRVALLAVATAALALVVRPIAGIIELTTFAGALMGAAVLPAICVGLSAQRVPAYAAGLSIALGVLGAAAGKLGPAWLGIRSPWFQDVIVGLAASTLGLAPWLLRARGSPPPAPSP